MHQGTRASIPCSAAEARRKTPSVTNKILKNPTDRWLSPYEPEDTRSKRVRGISHHIAQVHQGTRAKYKELSKYIDKIDGETNKTDSNLFKIKREQEQILQTLGEITKDVKQTHKL